MCSLIIAYSLPFDKFLRLSVDYTMNHINEFTISELSFIASAYSGYFKEPRIINKIESIVLENAKSISLNQCIDLMQSFLLSDCGEDLWLMFDMIIGRNVRKVSDTQIVPILETYSKSPFKREKLFSLFIHKIKSSSLSVSDNCKLVKIYSMVQFDQPQIFEFMQDRLFLKIGEMTDEDMVDAFIGFSNPNIQKQFKIVKILEDYVMQNIEKVSLENAARMLLNYGNLRKGKKDAVLTCRERVDSAVVETEVQKVPPQTVLE